MTNSKDGSRKIFELVLFSMLGALMLASDLAMEALPNIHVVGMLTVTFTAVFRSRALIPLYVYVFLTGLIFGFSFWWLAYLYAWLPLWGAAMLVPKSAPRVVKGVIYPIINLCHGLLFGALNAPLYAIAYGMGFDGMLAWIASGLGFDLLHAAGNFAFGFLILPLSELLQSLLRRTRFFKR